MKKRMKKFLEVLNSKPVIGLGIFIMLSMMMVFAGNVIVKEGSVDISGDLTVNGSFSNPSIKYYAISAMDFKAVEPDVKDVHYDRSPAEFYVDFGGSFDIYAPVHLPDGAIVTEIRLDGNEAAEGDRSYTLYRSSHATGTINALGGTSLGVAKNSFSNSTIDNENYSYFVYIYNMDTDYSVYGGYIKYIVS